MTEKIGKTLVLVPDLQHTGGVSNYFRTLRLDSNANIKYFIINKAISQSTIKMGLRILVNYCLFFFTIIKGGYQLIHINPSLDRNSFYRDSIFILLSRMLKRKTLVFFRGWLDMYAQKIKKSRFKAFLFRISYAKADKYIVLSSIFKEKLIELGVPHHSEFHIETTVADASYLGELDLVRKYSAFKEKIIFLFISRIAKSKGIFIAIDAYGKFVEQFPQRQSCLIIAGDGPDLDAARRYVEVKNIPQIVFLGHVSGETKKKLFLESHVMICPSYSEGLPNSILEGMLYGMPIISRATGGIPEVIQQEINGYLSESYDPLLFTDFLSTIASDGDLYAKISNKNYGTAIERFTPDKVRERILKIYESY